MKRGILFGIIFLCISTVAGAQTAAQKFMALGCSTQTISLTQPNDMAVGDADQTITCSSTSTGACALSTNNASYCTIVGGKLHAVGASGTNGCIVYADQAGGSGWCPAAQVSKSVTISAAANPCAGTITYKNQALTVADCVAAGDPTYCCTGAGTGTCADASQDSGNTGAVYANTGSNAKYYTAAANIAVCKAGGYIRSTNGSAAKARFAVYKVSDDSLICQAATELSITSQTEAWVYQDMPANCNVDSGTNYYVAFAVGSANLGMREHSEGSEPNYYSRNTGKTYSADGFPNPMSWDDKDNFNYRFVIGHGYAPR